MTVAYFKVSGTEYNSVCTRPLKEVSIIFIQFSSVAQLCPTLGHPWTAACQASLSITTPGIYSNSCLLSRWCHPTISFSVVPFSSCLQSSPKSGSYQWVISSHQVAKVLEFQLQHQSFQWTCRTDFFRMDLLDLPESKGFSRVFSNTTVQAHQFFSAQLFLYSNSHIHTWPLEKP